MPTDPKVFDAVDNYFSAPLNADKSPDDAARAFELNRATGVPAESINEDIPGFEAFHKQQLGQQIIDNNSDIADFINRHPLHGQLIHDDLGNLDDYSRAYRRIAPGGHPFGQFLQGFFEQFQGPEEIKRRAEERWHEKIPDYPRLAEAGARLIGIPSEMAFREPILGLLEGSRKALKAFYVNSGVGSDQDADRFANEWVDLLGYQLMKPEVKLAIQPGPLRGEVLPPEAPRPTGPAGLPRPPTTIDLAATKAPTIAELDARIKDIQTAESKQLTDAGLTPDEVKQLDRLNRQIDQGSDEAIAQKNQILSKLPQDLPDLGLEDVESLKQLRSEFEVLERQPGESPEEYADGLARVLQRYIMRMPERDPFAMAIFRKAGEEAKKQGVDTQALTNDTLNRVLSDLSPGDQEVVKGMFRQQEPEPSKQLAGPTDLTRRGFLKGVASIAASRAVPGGVGKLLQGLHPNAMGIARDYFIDHITGLPLQSREMTIKTLDNLAKINKDFWDKLSPEDLAEENAKIRSHYDVGLITEEEMNSRLGGGIARGYSDAAKLLRSGWMPKPDRSVIEAFANREADAIRPYLEAGERPPTGVSDIIDEIEAQQVEASQKATDEVIAARDKTALSQRSPEKLEEFTRGLPSGTTRIGIEAFDKLGQVPPDVAPGYVRLYHGGSNPQSGGGRWVSPHLAYARGYRPGEPLHYVDIPQQWMNQRFPDTELYTGPYAQPYPSFEAPEEFAKQMKPVGDSIPKELSWIPDLEAKLAGRPTSISVPTNLYIAKIDKDIHKEIKEFVSHGEDLSPAEVKELKESKALRAGAETIKSNTLMSPDRIALQTTRDSAGLNPIVTYAEFLELEDVQRLLDMVARKASPEEFMADPFIKKFMEEQDQAPLTATKEQARDPAWRENRTYVWRNQPIKGNAIIDKIIADATEGRAIKHDKVLTLVTGPPGAGKSSITDPLAKELGAAVVNSDAAKDLIPEYRGGQGIYAVHRESVALSEAAIDRLIDQGANIMIEKLGNTYQDIGPQLEAYKQLGYKVNLVHVGAPLDVIVPRIIDRFIRTGRIVALTHAASVVDKTYPGYEKLKEIINGSAAAYDTSAGFPARLVDGAGTEIARSMEAGGGGRDGPPIPPREGGPPPGEPTPRPKRIFAKAKAFGRTEREYSAYEKLIAERDQEDIEWRLKRAQKQADRENSQAWKDEAARITSEVRDEIATRPEIQAYRIFENGKDFGLKRSPRLDPTKLTPEQKALVPERFLATRGGWDPDAIASLVDLDTGNDLVAALASIEREAGEGRGDILDRLTQAEVDRRVDAKLGEDARDRLDEVKDHALSITQLEMLHEQMLRLGTQIGAEIPLTRDATRLGALNLLHQETFGGMSSRRYMRDSDRAFRRLEKALLVEDPNEAFKNAQQQSISAEMAKEARQVEKEYKRFQRRVKQYRDREGPAGTDQQYTNWIHEILNRIGEGRREPNDLRTEIEASTEKTLPDFLDARTAEGYIIDVDESVLNLPPQELDNLSVLQARRVFSAIESLHKNSRDTNKIYREGEQRDLKQLQDQMATELESLGVATQVENRPGVWNGFRAKIRWYNAQLLQVESLLNRWDRGNAFGTFNQWIGRPLIEAANYEAQLQREIAKDYTDLPHQLTAADLNKTIPNTIFREPGDAWNSAEGKFDFSNADPIPFTRKHLRAVLLNAGNASNLKKLADGYQVEPEVIKDWLDTYATKEDWEWAQAHGKIFEKLKKLSDRVYRNLSGIAKTNVPLEGVQTRQFGNYEGWYHPIIYDPTWKGNRVVPSKPADLFVGNNPWSRPNTPAAYTHERTAYVAPVDLNLDQVPARLSQEIHDITFHEPVLNASKIIMDPKNRFVNTVTKHAGLEYSKLFEPWLRDIANARNYNAVNQDVGLKVQNYLRSNIIGTWVGLNPGTVMKHTPTALANSIYEVGGREFADAVQSLFSSRTTEEGGWQWAIDTFDELQRRHQNWMENVSGAQEAALAPRGFEAARHTVASVGTIPVAFFDLLSAVPTAVAAYKTALDEGRSIGDAIYAGNRAVRRPHGSTAITSRPAIMREHPNVAYLYNFTNRMYQYGYEYAWRARDALTGRAEGKKAEYGKMIAWGLFATVLFAGFVETIVSDIDDKDTWESLGGKSILNGITLPLIGIKQFIHAAMHGSDPQYALGSEELKMATDLLRDMYRKDLGFSRERAGKTVKHFNNFMGLTTGLTNGEVGNLAEYVTDLVNGKARPRNGGDWWRGIRRGKIDKPTSEENVIRLIERSRR